MKYVEENELESIVDLEDIEFNPLKTGINRYCTYKCSKSADQLFFFEIDAKAKIIDGDLKIFRKLLMDSLKCLESSYLRNDLKHKLSQITNFARVV